ncbi:MAG: ABC transporter ATP-binding protein [Lachnospiraceae bacterium]|nr:ABC transporter ATP-binding protein [Lachnospiraceae bacterium]
MLEVNGLSKKYGRVLAADEVTFSVPEGKVGILLGPNGAGKSTVIKSVAGLLKYTGEVKIAGIPAKEKEAKRAFAYVPEMPALFEALTVREHIEYIRMAYGSDITEEEILSMLTRFEMEDKQDKLGNELSKGMMQKVSICCALAIKPKVMILDEPMVGLDPKAIKELKVVVEELSKAGTTVLLSTHMLEMVKDMWDVMFIMDKGKIIASYTKEEAEHREIDELFFTITDGGEA